MAHVADDDLRRDGVGLDHDDRDWPEITVPGHWRTSPAFSDADGPLLYRHHFHLEPPAQGERRFITLDGVLYQADVWLDGAYLGDPEGSFFPHSFDITGLSRLADDHVLAVEVNCPRGSGARRTVTGALLDHDTLDPDWNPGGLWRAVRIESSGPARIDRLRVVCRDANDARAHLRLHARLDLDRSRTVVVRTKVDGRVLAEHSRSLAAGANEVDWDLDVHEPRLWWPWALGAQRLTDVEVEVLVDEASSDRRLVRTGLREVAVQEWVISVNGERLFAKGADIEPAGLLTDGVPADDVRRLVSSAKHAGLDLLRVRGHVARPELYEAADELGILLWQDFPLRHSYARAIRRQAVRQAREMVDLLAHHPSIVLWCAHDAPRQSEPVAGSTVARVVRDRLPTWNTVVLDRWVRRAIENADESRPTVAHGDSGMSLGWEHGSSRDLDGLVAAVPSMARFVTSFGAAAVPTTDGFMAPQRWPHLDWDALRERHALRLDLLDRHVPRSEHPDFGSWRDATQQHQAEVLRHHIETLRRLKYRPAGGFCLASWNDPRPVVGTGVFDHDNVPKSALRTVVDACRPVIVVADRLPTTLSAGNALALDVHVVNDLRRPLDDAVCTATLRWPGGGHTWSWRGSVPTDSCVRVGTVQFVVPDVDSGDLDLDLTVEHPDVVATNRYTAALVPSLGVPSSAGG